MHTMHKKLFAAGLLTFVLMGILLPSFASANTFTPFSFNEDGNSIIPDCKPEELPGSGSNPCGLNAFADMLKKILKWCTAIIIPIAFCMIGYAGFIILTSTGNGEKLSKGYGMIKIAITGVVILLISYLIVEGIYNALDIPDTIDSAPTGIDTDRN